MIDLNDFESTDFQQWKEKVINDLGLSSIDELNLSPLAHEIEQPPYVDFTTAPVNDLIMSYRHCQTHNGEEWQGARYWISMEMIESRLDAEANHLALLALTGGADGIIFPIDEQTNWEQLLLEISLEDCFIGVRGSVDSYIKLKSHLDKHRLIMRGFAWFTDLDHHIEQPSQIAPIIQESPSQRMLFLKEHESSLGSLDELARLLSHTVWVTHRLTEHGVPLKAIFLNIQLGLELSNAYLWEICRLRCLRILLHQIVVQYGVTDIPPKSLSIHAFTTVSDPDQSSNTSLISNPGQAIAAVLGGCDILSVISESADTNTETLRNRRVARNVSHILKQECYLHKISDPVAGAYYLEDLTLRMLKQVWSRFQAIEESGGYKAKMTES